MRRETKAIAETMATAILWGTSFPVISVGIKAGLGPLDFVFLRFAMAAPILLVVAFVTRRDIMGLLRTRPVWVLGFLNAVGFLSQFVGQQFTDPSVAALLVNLSVILAAVGSVIFLNERLGTAKLLGVALAVAGTILLATRGDLATLTSSQLAGDAYYLVSAVSWGAYIVYAKRKTDELSWDPVAISACLIPLTALFVLPTALLSGLSAPTTQLTWEIVGYTALVNTAIPYVLYQSGLRYLTATASAVVLALEIVTAVIVSAVFLGVVLNAASAAGAIAVIVSILLVSKPVGDGKSLSVREAGRRVTEDI